MSRRNPIFAITAALFGLCFAAPASAAPDVTGQWELVAPLPWFAIHSNLLPNGKVMLWPGDIVGGGVDGNDPRAWDPATQIVSPLSKPGYNIFCVGHTFMADGSLFTAGGHISANVGLSLASKYNYLTDTWTSLPDMNDGRWYPTTTVLANGDVLTIAGDIDTMGVNPLPQVMEAKTGTWRNLTSAQMLVEDYARMFLAPNGKVLLTMPSSITRYLDTSGTGAWTPPVAIRHGDFQDYGSAVMYAPGKILVAGGGDPPVNMAEVIDLNQASPSWRLVGSMQYARRHQNATLLPDGKVLVTGGTASPGYNDPTGHVDAAELWDPATETWTTLAGSTGIPRVYHSSALLLPDGRVFSTGGNGYPDTEIFSPPYLFKGARPTITSAPSSINFGQSFTINTPDAASISKVTLLRLGAVTHAFNMSQVINTLSFSKTTGVLNVQAPAGGTVAPPGYYMLFILNGSGVPSIANFVKIGIGSNPTVSISAPANGAAVAGSAVAISASAFDNVGVSGVQFKLDGSNLGAEDTTSPYAVTWDSTTATAGSHTLTAVARNAAGLTTTSANVSVTVNNTTTQLPDLIVTQLSYANGIFTSTVKNQGNAAIPAGVAIGVGYLVNSVSHTWGAVVGPLAAGASVTIGSDGGPYTIPTGNYSITAFVDDLNHIVELDETNNQLSQSITVGSLPSLPDVIVTQLSYANGIFTSTVVNQGAAATPAGVAIGVAYSVDGVQHTWGAVIGPLAAGASVTIGSDGGSYIIPAGAHTIMAYVDDVNRIVERSETNNQIIEPITVGSLPSLPDVIVTQLSYANGIFTSTVVNQGAAATPAGVAIGVAYNVDGVQHTWGAVIGPLAAGASVTIGSDGGSYIIPTGTHTIMAYADDANRFAESNETNNQLSQSITVGSLPSLPDVIVTQLSYANGIFTSTVKNQGAAAIPAGVAIGVAYNVDGVQHTWGAVIGPLAAGASVTIGSDGGSYIIPTGTHTIMAYADDVNRFTESNETNNQLSQSITVP